MGVLDAVTVCGSLTRPAVVATTETREESFTSTAKHPSAPVVVSLSPR
jgi:hypothetical protein